MPNIFFTADTHFGHSRILKYCASTRKFASIQDHDEYLVEAWNRKVQPEDTVYLLGDAVYGDNYSHLRRLNGNKILVLGNHDVKHLSKDAFTSAFSDMRTYLEVKVSNKRVVLFHYPMEEWNGFFRGFYHFHGHTHSSKNNPKVTTLPNRFDVGIDRSDGLSPFEISDIILMSG